MVTVTVALVVFSLSLPFLCYGAKLNEPKVLLPYFSNYPSSYEIEIHETRGCFKWRSSRPEVATVTASGDPSCSNSVIVTAQHRDPGRVTAFLLAENEETGEVLRCDVIVDSITEIGIETTTRELYLDDSTEKFQIWARDSEGNTFSTLDAVPFEWSLISDKGNEEDMFVDAHDVLRIIPFRDSSYDTPPHIEIMESKGLQGDTILLEGVKTGSANVQVKLRDQVYKSVSADTVKLIVIANIMLSPPDAYILLFTSLKYRAHVIKQGVMHEILLPSVQYLLEVNEKKICSLSVQTSEVYGEALGSTQVVLRDKNMPVKLLNSFHQPTASVHVVLPAYIGFSVEPGRLWILESGREYAISVHVFDKDRHPIHLSENVRLKTDFVNKYFEIIRSSINGSYHMVKAIAPGRTEIKSVLVSVIKKDGTEYKIKSLVDGAQRVDIFEPITITPKVLVFPWMAERAVVYTAQLKARGGSGDYAWTTNDTTIVDISPKTGSTVQLHTKNQVGTTVSKAADVKNSLHFAMTQAYVIPPEDMRFNPEYVEFEVGSELDLPLAIFGLLNDERLAFTDCTQLPLTIVIESDVFVYNPDDSNTLPVDGVSCTSIRLRANRSGHTKVKASSSHGNVKLTASITIAAFDPLVPVDPTERSVLAQTSSRELLFKGGPQPWVLDASQYFENGRVNDRKIVSVHRRKGNNVLHKLLATCLELGDQEVTLTVGNKPTATNKHPAERTAAVKIHCKEPVGVQLKPQVPQPQNLPPCPVTLESDSPIPAHSYRKLPINVVVMDDNGREFDNISSLHFNWKVSDESLALVDLPNSINSSTRLHKDIPAGFTWFQTLIPTEKTGIVIVSLELNWKLNKEVSLLLVDDAVLVPGEVTLFNHPESSAILDVKGGSGHFVEKHEPEKLATLQFSEQKRRVVVSPLLDGDLRVHVLDLCLQADSQADSVIHMSGARRIQLILRDKVQLTNSLVASVQVLDHGGNPLPAAYFKLMKLKPNLDIQSERYIKIAAMENPDQYTAMFTVTGVGLGTARLSFTAQAQRSLEITSNTQDVQVFPPLRLEPRNVTMLVGADLQVQAVGGPQPQSIIEYFMVDEHDAAPATVSGSGLVKAAAIGAMLIRARAVGVDGETGEQIVYSQDTGEVSIDQISELAQPSKADSQVHVVKLLGVRLYAPLSRLQTNTRMPVYAMGLSDQQTPFSFANVFPPLSFEWTTSNGEVASLQSVYHRSNIRLPVESRFSQQLLTKREGHVTIKLRVTVKQKQSTQRIQQIHDNKAISDEAHIQVFDSLELISPVTCAGQVLMTPNTEARLKTNRDSAAQLAYRVQGESSLLTVQKNGDIVSGSQSGVVSVLVTATERFGTNQTLLILVKIKPVSYVMLNCETAFNTEKALHFIPVGSVLQYRVSSHDELGQQFDFTNSQLRFRPNRFDLLQVKAGPDNGTVTVRAPRVSPFSWGGTALKVWDVKQPRMADYININVQKAIEAAPAYTAGDVICFTAPLLSISGESGTWSSDNEKHLVIEGQSGHALAVHPGSVTVRYDTTSQVSTVQVRVEALNKLQIDSGSMKSLTLDGQTHTVRIVINDVSKSTCSGISRPADTYPYQCSLSATFSDNESQNFPNVNQLFTVEPTWNTETGIYGCSLTSHPPSSYLKSLLSSVEGTLTLTATSNDGQIRSHPVTLQFLPPVDLRTKELHLTPTEPVSYIEVSATTSTIAYLTLKTEGRLSSILHHSSPSKDGDVYKIPVSLSTYNPVSTEGSLTLIDRLADQSYEIRVHIVAGNLTNASQTSRLGQLLWNHTDLMIFVIACVVVITICLLMGYFAVFGSKTTQAAPANNLNFFPNSPISSIGSSSPQSGDCGTSPFLRQRMSAGRVALWSSGYEPQEANQSDIALFRKSPSKLMSPAH